MKNIVSVDWLYKHLEDPSLRIIDCRFELGNPTAGFNAYLEKHLPGALYFDLEKDLSSKVQTVGGRHPLPDMERFVDKLSTAGIDANTKVVAYDDQSGMMASRLWWLLKYVGHESVYILDGGYSKWEKQSYPTSNEIPVIPRKEFIPTQNTDLLASMDEVKENLETQASILIDAREAKRYEGKEEPIDIKAGHIPGAMNYFWKDCMNGENEWKSTEELKDHFNDVPLDASIIVYCGSGVSACPNIVALDELGYQNTKLYVGSWSDWISYKDNSIAVGESK